MAIHVAEEKSEAQGGAGARPRSHSPGRTSWLAFPQPPRRGYSHGHERTLTALSCPFFLWGAESRRSPGAGQWSPADGAESQSHGPPTLRLCRSASLRLSPNSPDVFLSPPMVPLSAESLVSWGLAVTQGDEVELGWGRSEPEDVAREEPAHRSSPSHHRDRVPWLAPSDR